LLVVIVAVVEEEPVVLECPQVPEIFLALEAEQALHLQFQVQL
jgi:hypothetical protein